MQSIVITLWSNAKCRILSICPSSIKCYKVKTNTIRGSCCQAVNYLIACILRKKLFHCGRIITQMRKISPFHKQLKHCKYKLENKQLTNNLTCLTRILHLIGQSRFCNHSIVYLESRWNHLDDALIAKVNKLLITHVYYMARFLL